MANIIEYNSEEGKKLLHEVIDHKWPYQKRMLESFGVQTGRAACGIRSSAIIISGILRAHKETESNTYLPVELGALEALSYPTEKALIDYLIKCGWTTADRYMPFGGLGMTLDELGEVLPMFSCPSHIVHAADSTVDRFREESILALSSITKGVIVNYKQDVLGQAFPYGHISPLAAYHVREDRFLLLDTWPESSLVWAKADPLFRAMNTIDNTCNKTRGYALVSSEITECLKMWNH